MGTKSAGDLHESLITEILVRLPVKTLVICKSVCKPWLHIISDPHFVKSQLHRALIASTNNPTLLTIQDPLAEKDEEGDDYATLRQQAIDDALLDFSAQDLLPYDCIVLPRLFHDALLQVITCSCNGLICLANRISFCCNDVYIWNPSIRQCKKLPASKTYKDLLILVKVGFGYDSISDSYKVFKILYQKKGDRVPIVQLYSTNTNSWTEFRSPILKNWNAYDPTNIVVDGLLYFYAQNGLIFSFDLHKDIFGLVPSPSFPKRSDILNFQGSVAMVFESEQGMDLYTLDESWTKSFGIQPADSGTKIWLSKYLGAGQFYGKNLFNHQVFFSCDFLYDYEKKKQQFYKLPEDDICGPIIYTETLVSLDGFVPVE